MNSTILSKRKNSIIELLRFLFALNVVKGHGYFPIDFSHFGPARISVEFFFVLSGFLFYNSLNKYKDMSYSDALKSMLKSKFSPLLVPTVIGLVSNIIYNSISDNHFLNIWGYLWYVQAMLVALGVFVILRIKRKDDRQFFKAVIGIFIVSTLLRFSGVQIIYEFCYVRSLSTISLGILVASLPKIQFKSRWISWLIFLPISVIVFSILCFYWADIEWFGWFLIVEAILDLVLYPALIYFAFMIDISVPLFNYLGALSYGLYAFQCPARVVEHIGIFSRWVPFSIIVGATLIEDLIKRIRKKRNFNKL